MPPRRWWRRPRSRTALGIGQLLIKNESSRLGLPAFKILGASWAVYRTLETRLGRSLEPWRTVEDLAQRLAPVRPLTLATATDGNHGRAVAHVASLFGFAARIFRSSRNGARRESKGSRAKAREVEVVAGTYDDAVARAAEEAGERCLVVSDTSWPGYEEIPRWVTEGYSTILHEIDDELARRGEKNPDSDRDPIRGRSARRRRRQALSGGSRPNESTKIVSVEPLQAACVLASMEAGEIVTVPGPHDSIMAGLNCGRPSLVAWPIVSRGIDAFLAISDERAREAMRALARLGIVAGETGGAGLAGLLELVTGAQSAQYRKMLGITERSRV